MCSYQSNSIHKVHLLILCVKCVVTSLTVYTRYISVHIVCNVCSYQSNSIHKVHLFILCVTCVVTSLTVYTRCNRIREVYLPHVYGVTDASPFDASESCDRMFTVCTSEKSRRDEHKVLLFLWSLLREHVKQNIYGNIKTTY